MKRLKFVNNRIEGIFTPEFDFDVELTDTNIYTITRDGSVVMQGKSKTRKEALKQIRQGLMWLGVVFEDEVKNKGDL